MCGASLRFHVSSFRFECTFLPLTFLISCVAALHKDTAAQSFTTLICIHCINQELEIKNQKFDERDAEAPPLKQSERKARSESQVSSFRFECTFLPLTFLLSCVAALHKDTAAQSFTTAICIHCINQELEIRNRKFD